MAADLNLICVLEENDCEMINSFLESDDNDVIILAAIACFMRRNLNRIDGFFEETIPRYLGFEFQNHFRMTRETCELFTLEVVATGEIPVGNPSGRPAIPPEKLVLIFLWALANKEPNRAIADRFNVTMSSAHRALRRVTKATLRLYPRFIKWPNTREANEIATAFQEDGFPGVVGLIDGTHIQIRAPESNPDAYINRKKMYSLNVQVVCDNNMVFLDILAGWPGSVHDTRVLRNSGLYQTAANKFPGDKHLLGDGGYPLLRWLITPFRDNGHLTPRQRQFNSVLSSVRQTVERSISLLKGRWRKLQYLDHLDLVLAVQIITSACVVHNFCLVHDDFNEGYFLPDDDVHEDIDDNVDPPDGTANQKRQHLMNNIVL